MYSSTGSSRVYLRVYSIISVYLGRALAVDVGSTLHVILVHINRDNYRALGVQGNLNKFCCH